MGFSFKEVSPWPWLQDSYVAALGSTLRVLGLVFTLTSADVSYCQLDIFGPFSVILVDELSFEIAMPQV
jgi:hypothetical protein